jgi:hypothetical protein
MRRRIHGIAGATATCAGVTVALAGLVSCVSDDNAPAAPVDASLPDVGQPDTSFPRNDVTSPPVDAGTDTTVPVDSSSPDASQPDANDASSPSDAADAADAFDAADAADAFDAADAADAFDANPGCVPGSVAAFVAPPYVHANPQRGVFCNDQQDQDMASLCLDAAAYDACSTFATTGDDGGVPANCGACLVTTEDAGDGGSYGPSIVGTAAAPNVAGCIELADPTDGGLACAMAVQAAWKCAEFSCAQNCPVTDDPSRAAYVACLSAAAAGPCAAYAAAASSCLAFELDAGGPAATWCVGAEAGAEAGITSDVLQFTDIARFFCSS